MKVLLLVPGPLAERMSAPEVRGWNMALELARHHEMTVAAPGSPRGRRDGITLIPYDRASVIRAACEAGAVVAPGVPPYLYATLAAHPALLVADMYNPAAVEQAQIGGGLAAPLRLALIRANDAVQLKFADVVLCAVSAQRRRLSAEIAALAGGAVRQPLLRVVPFGIDNDPPPAASRRPIRARFPSIAPEDTVVLWWGNVWPWFDAATALRAFAQVAGDHRGAKLVFTAGRPPRAEASAADETGAARKLAAEMGLLDTSVYFVDDWIPHAERHEYLQEADVALTLHHDTVEKEVAARGRYMDYLWAGLPCVLGQGDELADRFASGGFAATVRPGDVIGAADALRRLIESPEALASARAAADPLRAAFRWSAVVEPLVAALDELAGRPPVRSSARARLPVALARAYACRTAFEAARVGDRLGAVRLRQR